MVVVEVRNPREPGPPIGPATTQESTVTKVSCHPIFQCWKHWRPSFFPAVSLSLCVIVFLYIDNPPCWICIRVNIYARSRSGGPSHHSFVYISSWIILRQEPLYFSISRSQSLKKRKKKLKNHTNIEGKGKKNEKKFLTLGYNENEVDWKGITLG